MKRLKRLKRLAFTLSVSLVAACTPDDEPVFIDFGVVHNGQPVSCTSGPSSTLLTDLRFFVHDIVLLARDGTEVPVRITNDDMWQAEGVALVDLETGDGACINGSRETHSVVGGRYAGGPVNGIRFRIGLPEALNHRDPLTADAPLSYTVMHWHWASGYKFVRAGIERGNDSVFLHLGSSRCEGTIGNIQGCKSANRPSVELMSFDPESQRVLIDTGLLFHEANLDDGDRSDCMSGPANRHCEAPFSQLGLDREPGTPRANAPAFRAGPKP